MSVRTSDTEDCSTLARNHIRLLNMLELYICVTLAHKPITTPFIDDDTTKPIKVPESPSKLEPIKRHCSMKRLLA